MPLALAHKAQAAMLYIAIFSGYPDLSVFPTHEQARRHLGVKPDFVVAFRVVSMYH